MSIRDELVQIRNRAWTTSGARYNASRRLRTRSKLSLATISLVSALGVATPLLMASQVFALHRDSLGVYSALLSLFILVVAVIEGAASYESKADALFRNAEQLNALRLKINVWLADETSPVAQQLLDASQEYDRARSECPINHEVVDFRLQQATHPADYNLAPSQFRKFARTCHFYLYSTWWLTLISVAALLGLYVVLTGEVRP